MTRDSKAYEYFLEQARKFQVFLIFAHQTNHQLVHNGDDSLLKAVGNITFELHFRASHDDAVYEAGRLFEPELYQIKYQERMHTQLKTWQDVLIEKAWDLKKLWRSECYVRYSRDELTWWQKHLLKFNLLGLRKIKTVR